MDKSVEVSSQRVMTFYPEGLSRDRILAILQRIQQKLWPAVRLQVKWATFGALEDPTVRGGITAASSQIDTLCVATQDRADLPPQMRRWLWSLPSRPHPKPLLALLDISQSPDLEEPRAAKFLRHMAATRRMDFLPYYTADLADHHRRPAPFQSPQTIILQRPPQFWRQPPEPSRLNE